MAHIENSLGNITFNDAQDNNKIVKVVTIPYIANQSVDSKVLIAYNNLPTFTVSETQIVKLKAFVATEDDAENSYSRVRFYDIITYGRGTYGIDGIQLTKPNLLFITENSITIFDIEDNPLTQIYTITDLGGLTVSEYINQLNPAFEFQDVSIAPRLIKVTQIGLEADYLFLPIGGLYGLGELQTIDADFQLLNNNAVNIIIGESDFIPKFTSEYNLGNSRIFDNGTNLGIDTITPNKDIDFGNQSNREISIQKTDKNTQGKNLSITAGSTDIGTDSGNFISLNEDLINYSEVTFGPDGSMYISIQQGAPTYTAGIFKKGPLDSDFSLYQATSTQPPDAICVTSTNDIYYAKPYDGIYKQTAGTGSFVLQSITTVPWLDVYAHPNGDVYGVSSSATLGGIYKQTAGTGSFVSLGEPPKNYGKITSAPNGDIYIPVYNDDIYKQTGGIGPFVGLGQTFRTWYGLTSNNNGDIYAISQNSGVYKQTSGVGNFIFHSFPTSPGVGTQFWEAIDNFNGDIYIGSGSSSGGQIYKLENPNGASNLNGGTLKLKAGKGKGIGQSRVEVYTSQKTVSGNDLQIETLRAIVDEEGRVIAPTLTEALINSGDNKTLITKEYLESQVGNYIPLPGTEVGSPIAGILETESITGFSSTQSDLIIGINDISKDLEDLGNSATLSFGSNTTGRSVVSSATFEEFSVSLSTFIDTLNNDGGLVLSGSQLPSGARGISSNRDFTPNITDLDYTQKIYVDTGLATKQDLLTNPITGTGTNNRLTKFTASGVIGNSILQEVSTTVKGIAIQNVTPTNTSFGYSVLNSASLTGTSNTGFGHNILTALTTGSNNSAFGYDVLKLITNGNNNTGFGFNCLSALSTGSENSSFGYLCFNNLTSGSANVVFGVGAGRFIADGVTPLTTCNQSVFLGNLTKAFTNTSVNEIVIGYNAIGAGSNTATIGNTSIVDTVLRGRVNLTQYATGSRPTYVKGALIYDSTLGKLVIGGNSGWEVVTSV